MVRKRTLVLGALAMTLALVDARFLRSMAEDKTARWIIRMPEVEKAQLNDAVMLVSSDSFDTRIPVSSIWNPYADPTEPSMFRDIWNCGPQAIFIDMAFDTEPQMPVRYGVIAPTNSKVASCIASRLPTGYVIEPGWQDIPYPSE